MIQKGMINMDAMDYIEKEALSYIYGWTPTQIDEMNPVDYYAYAEILKKRGEKGSKTPPVPKHERKQFR